MRQPTLWMDDLGGKNIAFQSWAPQFPRWRSNQFSVRRATIYWRRHWWGNRSGSTGGGFQKFSWFSMTPRALQFGKPSQPDQISSQLTLEISATTWSGWQNYLWGKTNRKIASIGFCKVSEISHENIRNWAQLFYSCRLEVSLQKL